MARTDPLTRLRLPDDLKARLKASSDANSRSMNAEIRVRLEQSFQTEAEQPEGQSGLGFIKNAKENSIARLEKRVAKLEAQLTRLEAKLP